MKVGRLRERDRSKCSKTLNLSVGLQTPLAGIEMEQRGLHQVRGQMQIRLDHA